MTWCTGLALVGALAGCGQSAAVRPVAPRGRAIEVPGLAALNKGQDADLASVSCASAGNCAAGGYYADQQQNYQGFVVSERNGRWGQAVEVPGLGALSKGGNDSVPAGVSSVSCASPGNCAAGGDYENMPHGSQGFVVSEKNGVWRRAINVPGLAALNKGGGWGAAVNSVSCAPAGGCAAGGHYLESIRRGNMHVQGFVN